MRDTSQILSGVTQSWWWRLARRRWRARPRWRWAVTHEASIGGDLCKVLAGPVIIGGLAGLIGLPAVLGTFVVPCAMIAVL